jgi:hexosaminidase
MLALSEVVWSDPAQRDFLDFARRLPWHLDRLDAQGIRYRIPDVVGLERDHLTLDDHMKVRLEAPVHGTIHYTVDDSEPGAASPVYREPLDLDVEHRPMTVRALMVLPDGRVGHEASATFSRTTPQPAALVDVPMEPGLNVDVFEGDLIRRAADIEERGTFDHRDRVDEIAVPRWATGDTAALRFRAYLAVPEDDVYTFGLRTSGGALLRFGGAVVLDADSPGRPRDAVGQVALAKGLHPVEVLYFGSGEGGSLELRMARGDGRLEPVPQGALLRIR